MLRDTREGYTQSVNYHALGRTAWWPDSLLGIALLSPLGVATRTTVRVEIT